VKRLARAARLAAALAALTVAGAGGAGACAICLSAVSVTTGEEIDASDRAVLAAPDRDGLRVVAVVRGETAVGAAIPASTLVPAPEPPAPGAALLLVHNALAGTWKSLGATDPENADWLRHVAGASGSARLALVASRLEDPDPLVAEIAHDEIALSPYPAMVRLENRIDPGRLRGWIADPETGPRRATYILLLGITGGPEDAAAIEARLAAAGKAQDATDAAALLAADLELRGPGRMDWIEQTYLADPARTLPEIEAALLALAVHGDTDGTVPRERVVEAYRRFIRARPAMAGFVAPELAEWGAWQATGDYAALIAAGAVTDPAEEFAILTYLQQSPDPAAKAALADD
jgi:hypothetical protein